MPYRMDDRTKERLAAAGRHALGAARTHGRPTIAWLWKRRMGIAVTLLVLYILLPKCEPEPRTVVVPVQVTAVPGRAATRPTSQPTTQVTDQYAGDLPLFNPAVQGSDARWSMPAELSGLQLHALVDDVDRLAKVLDDTSVLQRQYDEKSFIFMSPSVLDQYWVALRGRGFRDKTLPLDWSAAVRDRYDVVAEFGGSVSMVFDYTIRGIIDARLGGIKVRLIGGQVLIADQLFVKTFDTYITERHARFKRLATEADNLSRRTAAEFGTKPGE